MALKREDLDVMEITVRARLTVDPERSENLVEFWSGNCEVVGENGEKLGSIKSGFGSNVTLFDDANSHEGWTVYADDLWRAFQEALRRRLLNDNQT